MRTFQPQRRHAVPHCHVPCVSKKTRHVRQTLLISPEIRKCDIFYSSLHLRLDVPLPPVPCRNAGQPQLLPATKRYHRLSAESALVEVVGAARPVLEGDAVGAAGGAGDRTDSKCQWLAQCARCATFEGMDIRREGSCLFQSKMLRPELGHVSSRDSKRKGSGYLQRSVGVVLVGHVPLVGAGLAEGAGSLVEVGAIRL